MILIHTIILTQGMMDAAVLTGGIIVSCDKTWNLTEVPVHEENDILHVGLSCVQFFSMTSTVLYCTCWQFACTRKIAFYGVFMHIFSCHEKIKASFLYIYLQGCDSRWNKLSTPHAHFVLRITFARILNFWKPVLIKLESMEMCQAQMKARAAVYKFTTNFFPFTAPYSFISSYKRAST